MLTKQAVEEFNQIYFEKYGKRLNDEVALEQAACLLNLYKAVFFDDSLKIRSKKQDEKKI